MIFIFGIVLPLFVLATAKGSFREFSTLYHQTRNKKANAWNKYLLTRWQNYVVWPCVTRTLVFEKHTKRTEHNSLLSNLSLVLTFADEGVPADHLKSVRFWGIITGSSASLFCSLSPRRGLQGYEAPAPNLPGGTVSCGAIKHLFAQILVGWWASPVCFLRWERAVPQGPSSLSRHSRAARAMMESFRLVISHGIIQGFAKECILVQECHVSHPINLAWVWGCIT